MRFAFNDLEISIFTQFGDAIGPIMMVDGEAVIEWTETDWWISDISLGLADKFHDCADLRRHTVLSAHHNGVDWLRSLIRCNLEKQHTQQIEQQLHDRYGWQAGDPNDEHRHLQRELV